MPLKRIKWNNRNQVRKNVIFESTPDEFKQVCKSMKDWRKKLVIHEGREFISETPDPDEVKKEFIDRHKKNVAEKNEAKK